MAIKWSQIVREYIVIMIWNFELPDGLSLGVGKEMDISLAAEFDMSMITIDDVDLIADGVNMVLVTGDPAVANEAKFIKNGNNLRFEFHDNLFVPDDHSMRLIVGTNASGGTNKIRNPLVSGVYFLYIQTYQADHVGLKKDNGELAYNIGEGTVVTATVPSVLSFAVDGVAMGNACSNSGGNADVTTTVVSIPFGVYLGAGKKLLVNR